MPGAVVHHRRRSPAPTQLIAGVADAGHRRAAGAAGRGRRRLARRRRRRGDRPRLHARHRRRAPRPHGHDHQRRRRPTFADCPASLGAVLRRVLVSLVGALLLAGCRVDVTVDLVDRRATARAISPSPRRRTPRSSSRRRDWPRTCASTTPIAAGWTVEGPTPTDDGGLTVTLGHPVTSAAEATNLLASLGPAVHRCPRRAHDRRRRDHGDACRVGSTWASGFDAFANSELLASAGGAPFADELDGLTPAETMSVVLRADLPGEVVETTGERRDGALEVGGAARRLVRQICAAATTVQRTRAAEGPWARPLSVLALVLLLGWLVAAGAFMLSVARVRRRRGARRAV